MLRLEDATRRVLALQIVSHSNTITSVPYRSYQNPICETKGCISAAFSILNKMDETVNPCRDFYQYACGKWLKDSVVPAGNSKWSAFHQVAEQNLRTLKKIFDRDDFASNGDIFRKVRDYYSSCTNKSIIEERDAAPLKKLISDVGSWSVTGGHTWTAETWNFEQALSLMHKLKSTPLFYMFVAADDKNSSQNIIQIQQAGITLSDREYYTRNESDKVVKKYKEFMVKIATLLNGATADSTTGILMDEIFQFEKKLAEIYEPKERLRHSDKIYHKMTVEDLQQLAPAIPWMDYMNNLFSTPVGHDEPVVVYTPTFLKSMSDLVIRTDRRILANYMVWHLIKPLTTELSKPYREAALDLMRVEMGVESGAPTWKSCVTKTDTVLGYATGHLYVKQHDGKDVKEKAKQVIQSIKEAFISNLPTVTWMDEGTKTKARGEKMESVLDLIGYPDWIMDVAQLNAYYVNLVITPEMSFENHLNARRFVHQQTMEKRGKAVDRKEWHMTPVDVNAYYSLPNNYIAFPSGILQRPFFDPEFPQAMNYGAVGMVMGHELTHGFDSKGRLFDKNGNLESWWKNQSVEAFEEHVSCMVEQYSNFTVADVKVDGKQTLDENIADNGGLRLAFQAHRQWDKENEKQPRLPGLELSRDQLFFLGFAQLWCSSSTKNSMHHPLLTDSHSPDRIRVHAAVSNSEQFAEAYDCPLDTPMNPAKKCRVW
ncbi:predicted protein [Nematostella vectensis]|uniref:Endothelin-converting enzyme 1 n=1 Tax=Nematostella vectensis TaxID=45351 RepID=A7S4D9_NEMVE|nr:predicted protein [Nematostella vectensis]|eukprot:XP_001633564.1 predicted protein [Nematostella vectensis]